MGSRMILRRKPEHRRTAALFLWFAFVSFVTLGRAGEQFGDVLVSPEQSFSGGTYHGYAETRVTLENHSSAQRHRVTLSFPNHSWKYGNCISRVSRTALLQPGTRVT